MIKVIEGITIKFEFENKTLYLPQKLKEEISNFWIQSKKINPNLFNGELICVSKYKEVDKLINITCKKTSYAHHLYDERIGIPKEYACHNLVVGCLLETNDNYYVIGEMASNTSVPNYLQIPGGNVDNTDIKANNLNVFHALRRECKEEINIDIQDKKVIDNLKLKYIYLPNKNSNAYLIIATAQLKMS